MSFEGSRVTPFGRERDRPPLTSIPLFPAPMEAWFETFDRGRDLTRPELDRLVFDLSRRRYLWQQNVLHSADERHYVQLLLNEHIDIWLICWCESQETGFHDHAGSRGAVAVVDGELVETLLTADGPQPAFRHRAGDRFSFGATRIHDVQHTGALPSTSLHVYSPPLGPMGFYEIGQNGVLTRRSGDYREELC
jgi:predicted metal-dependent enzyme (double-stranded beta helix superfamily)